MGDLWRSEKMELIQLFIHAEAAHDTFDELGQKSLVDFRDLNPHVNAFQRHYVAEVKRADEMLRTLRSFTKYIEQFNNEAVMEKQTPIPLNFETPALPPVSINELQTSFTELEKQLQVMIPHQEMLNRNHVQLVEYRHTLDFIENVLGKHRKKAKAQEEGEEQEVSKPDESLFAEDEEELMRLKFNSVAGVVLRSRWQAFERMVFRVTRGNMFMKYMEIKEKVYDTQSGEPVDKNVFVLYLHTGSIVGQKIRKSCDAFSVNLYTIPESVKERKSLYTQVNLRLSEIRILLDRGWEQKFQLLKGISENIPHWTKTISREKAVYHVMNKANYDKGRKCMIAEGWCPQTSIETVQEALVEGRRRSDVMVPSVLSIIETTECPPTYFKTNKFTENFQGIVNSYGTARYEEVNPAVFTIITFPFEFGIMFGDIGHGFILLIFSFYLLFLERQQNQKKTKMNEILELVYGGRYTILLMALFSIYIGSLYNEMFSVSLNFGSNWMFPENGTDTFVPSDGNWAYPYGVDPVWKGSFNELLYYNSLKMKTSIVIGIVQMVLGLFLHLANGIHFRHYYDIFFEFIPRLTFLLATFGYLVFMIFWKWNTDYREIGTSLAPSLLNEFIYMFLTGPDKVQPLYPYQVTVESILVVIALISVPIMFLPKPIFMLLDHKTRQKGYNSFWSYSLRPKRSKGWSKYEENPEDMELVALDTLEDKNGKGKDKDADGSEEYYFSSEEENGEKPVELEEGIDIEAQKEEKVSMDEEEEFDFSEAMVHQGLETIEFVLGCISHTASYLRLWALSLAHSELSTVFWEKAFFLFWEKSVGASWFVVGLMTFIAFSIWFAVTILVIMGMESLSAFLHALRLHWVEFQSKFYRGDGYPFIPFSFDNVEEAD